MYSYWLFHLFSRFPLTNQTSRIQALAHLLFHSLIQSSSLTSPSPSPIHSDCLTQSISLTNRPLIHSYWLFHLFILSLSGPSFTSSPNPSSIHSSINLFTPSPIHPPLSINSHQSTPSSIHFLCHPFISLTHSFSLTHSSLFNSFYNSHPSTASFPFILSLSHPFILFLCHPLPFSLHSSLSPSEQPALLQKHVNWQRVSLGDEPGPGQTQSRAGLLFGQLHWC